MFTTMRRKDRAMNEEQVMKMLEETQYGVLTTIGDHGYPCPTPVNFVYQNEKLYFHCAKTGEKVSNIERCNKVSLCLVNRWAVLPSEFSMSYDSAVIYGTCQEVFEQEKEEGLLGLIRKYSSDFMEEGTAYVHKAGNATRVFSVSIDHMTGKWQK